MSAFRILVCGDRHWKDTSIIYDLLNGSWNEVGGERDDVVLIEGGASGADAIAGQWAEQRFIEHWKFCADWDAHGKAAGPMRNQRMLDHGDPDVVYAFHDSIATSKGTKDMVARAKKANVIVYVIGHA